MKTFRTAASLRTYLDTVPGLIAFVPTMGALHDGHVALIRAAGTTHDLIVASIFVNPTQFNQATDLVAYPRTPREDALLLAANGCDVLYLPSEEDVYPEHYRDPTTGLDFGPLVEVMEGAERPGHFDGVAQVVYRLLDVVRPVTLFLGQKDYQQVGIVRSLVRQMKLDVAIKVIPTVREQDGLALSSRNRRLSEVERNAAASINLHLKAIASCVRANWEPRALEKRALHELTRHPLLAPEYVSIFDGDTLQPWREGQAAREIVVATAVHCGPVRLIDNFIVRTT
ncbi:pantoate--beta-alanine ligase [Neolewinella antarctica]|uniref:Pantothenate synthetase n=1 Tax=Neolewinella antarctica TaxID=442734 RepID=A0ABX0XAW3_9BACT|nr:pantoate--beta-alanine ligase [Neolewinella antarctica]NJC26210.1 pantoate--beta-alanine ligase [Neolewinella antarctica]